MFTIYDRAFFVKIVNGFWLLINFEKRSIGDVRLSSKYAYAHKTLGSNMQRMEV